MAHVSRAALRLSMLVGLALSNLILSGCSSGPNVDTTQWRPYRLATADDPPRPVRRAAPSPEARPIQAAGGKDAGTISGASSLKPWPRRGTREWDELQAQAAEQD